MNKCRSKYIALEETKRDKIRIRTGREAMNGAKGKREKEGSRKFKKKYLKERKEVRDERGI